MTMTEALKLSSSGTSRRSLLQAAVALGVAVPFLAISAKPAMAKMPQTAVAYQGSPKGPASCANCKLFMSPNACKSVDGTIAANGWCRIWVKS